jgi:hypothetical protein
VSGNLFQTFGISAWRGRLFTDADDVRRALPIAAISFRTWQERYGSDPSVMGAPYDTNGRASTIIGLAPPGPSLLCHTWETIVFWSAQNLVASSPCDLLIIRGRCLPGPFRADHGGPRPVSTAGVV